MVFSSFESVTIELSILLHPKQSGLPSIRLDIAEISTVDKILCLRVRGYLYNLIVQFPGVRLVGWVDARKPNNFLEYFDNLGWVSPFDPIGNTCSIIIAQPNLRL